MIVEAALAYAHLAAILAWVVFLSSTTALARVEWVNAETLARLQRVDRIALVAAFATLATGLVRTAWGINGAHWYAAAPAVGQGGAVALDADAWIRRHATHRVA